MIDFHSHMLPSIDDGSGSVEESLQMLQTSAQQGVQQICLTSHFYAAENSPEHFLERRQWAYIKLCEALKECTFDVPQLHLGAEVHYFEGIHRLKQLPSLMLEGTNILLLEMPFYAWQDSIWQTLGRLCRRRDIQIVIAHADRYPKENVERLIRGGVPLQLNAESLTKPLRRRQYLAWIENGNVKYLGSDIHMLGSGYRDWEKCRRLLERSFE